MSDRHVARATHRKLIGAWYTPEPFARMVVDWALDGSTGRVLDPSFGGCSFLRAATAALRSLGVAEPGPMVAGVDVDEQTILDAPQALVGCGLPTENIIRSDFLALSPLHLGQYAAVVGNPPYVRHHLMNADAQAVAVAAARDAGVRLPLRSGSWAYFVVHAARFVAKGGRMAFLLPGSVLAADYAEPALQYLRTHFGRLELVRLSERLFPDALEETVLLLASDAGTATTTIFYTEKVDQESLSSYLRSSRRSEFVLDEHFKLNMLDPAAADVFADLTSRPEVTRLGHAAKIRIGVVTGANDFFIRPKVVWDAMKAPTVPIVARRSWLVGATWQQRDVRRIDRNGKSSRLLALTARPTSRELSRLLSKGEEDYGSRHHCSLRDPWFAVEQGEAPAAFLGYMGASPPKLVLNETRSSRCTNAIHRLDFDVNTSARALAVGSWTSLFRLGCELHGRHYGGGVLKLEPSEAKRVPLPLLSDAADVLPAIDALARKGELAAATALADQVVLVKGLGLSAKQLTRLRVAADLLATRRKPPRRKLKDDQA